MVYPLAWLSSDPSSRLFAATSRSLIGENLDANNAPDGWRDGAVIPQFLD
jgi:hypothetical protein